MRRARQARLLPAAADQSGWQVQPSGREQLGTAAARCSPPFRARQTAVRSAGALALMQEVGDADVVRRWGAAWLADSGRDPAAPDVALACALAASDAASAALGGGDSLAAAALLEEGLAVLRAHAAAPATAAEISGALEVRPHWRARALPWHRPCPAHRHPPPARPRRGSGQRRRRCRGSRRACRELRTPLVMQAVLGPGGAASGAARAPPNPGTPRRSWRRLWRCSASRWAPTRARRAARAWPRWRGCCGRAARPRSASRACRTTAPACWPPRART